MEVGFLVIIVSVIVALAVKSFINSGSKQSKAEDKLLLLCRNDKSMLERLIAHEQKNKKLSRENAAKYAIESIRRDNR